MRIKNLSGAKIKFDKIMKNREKMNNRFLDEEKRLSLSE